MESAYQRLRFEFGLHGFGNFLRGAVAFFFVAPLPLGEVVVGALQAALGGEDVDVLHELVGEHAR